MRSRTFGVTAALLAAAVASGCQSTDRSEAPLHSTPAATQAATRPGTPAAAPSTTSSGVDAGDTFVMPNEVGKVLQTAQDDIQRVSGNPLFITYSVDATGQGRHQILDRDWKVCGQNVAPHKRVSPKTKITFSVVKLDESCP